MAYFRAGCCRCCGAWETPFYVQPTPRFQFGKWSSRSWEFRFSIASNRSRHIVRWQHFSHLCFVVCEWCFAPVCIWRLAKVYTWFYLPENPRPSSLNRIVNRKLQNTTYSTNISPRSWLIDWNESTSTHTVSHWHTVVVDNLLDIVLLKVELVTLFLVDIQLGDI